MTAREAIKLGIRTPMLSKRKKHFTEDLGVEDSRKGHRPSASQSERFKRAYLTRSPGLTVYRELKKLHLLEPGLDNGDRASKTLRKRQVLFPAILFLFWEAGSEKIRYSMPKETKSGSFVANLAKELGLRVGELATWGARIHYKGDKQLLQLDLTTGNLLLHKKLASAVRGDRSLYTAFPTIIGKPGADYSS